MGGRGVVVLKLDASCRWNCGLGKLSTILESKICVGKCTCSCLECSSLQIIPVDGGVQIACLVCEYHLP